MSEANFVHQDMDNTLNSDNVPNNSQPLEESMSGNPYAPEESMSGNPYAPEESVPDNPDPKGEAEPDNSDPQEETLPNDSHPPEETQLDDSYLPKETQVSQNNLGGGEVTKWPGWPGENVFRILVPAQKVGGLIGRKGEFIKKMCEETKARIKVLDGPPGTTERAVMVSAKEEPDLSIPPAMDGLLRVHKRVAGVDSDPASAPLGPSGTISTRLLVAATQSGSLIGKQGATIKSIQDASGCNIRVLGRDHLPVFALPDDSVVEIQGEPTGVHKAVELIATHLRKFLVDRSVVGVFETQMQNTGVNPNMPPPQPWGPPPQGFPVGPRGEHGFGPNPNQYMPPPRQFDNFYPPADPYQKSYPPADMPPIDKQPQQPRMGPPTYGRDASMGAHPTNVQPQQSIVTKVTQNMQISLSYADAVIGIGGSNISYIRRTSGASIAIQETKGVPGEMTVEINGSASQVQTAQQLIQNFIADASSSAQNAGAVPGQSSHPYPSYGHMYSSPQANLAGHAPTGDYGSTYGGNYGY